MIKITKDELSKLYLENNKSIKELSNYYECSNSTIINYLKKYNLKKRSQQNYYNKDWLYDQYILQNKSTNNIAAEESVSPSIILYFLKKFNIKKDLENINKSCEQTSIKKYGTRRPAQNINVKSKMQKTCLEKYGADNVFKLQEFQDIAKHTTEQKYGVDNVFKLQEFQDLAKYTVEQKYGVDNVFKLQEFQELSKNIVKKKYGKENIFSTEYFIKDQQSKGYMYNIDGNTVPEITKILNNNGINISEDSVRDGFKNNLFSNIDEAIELYKNYTSYNNLEAFFAKLIDFEFYSKKFDSNKFPKLNYKPDFKLSENLAINTDGLYWHSEKYKDKYYHFNMRKEYESRKLEIIQFHENEIYNKSEIIRSMIDSRLNNLKYKIMARKTLIMAVNQKNAEKFLESNHLMGSIKARHYGLYFENDLVCLLSYKIKNNNLKIERFCSRLNYNITGGFSKLLKYIENIEQSKFSEIHCWVDLRYGTGKYLEKLNFKYSHDTLGWKWTDGKGTFNRLQCRANMDERKLSEKEYAAEKGWYKIYDAGQRLYIKSL